MDGFFSAISASLVLLLLMAVGYFMGKIGWMTASEKRFLSKYIVNIAVPCNCITGLLNNLDHDSLLQAGIMVLSGMMGVAVTLVLSMALAKVRDAFQFWQISSLSFQYPTASPAR